MSEVLRFLVWVYRPYPMRQDDGEARAIKAWDLALPAPLTEGEGRELVRRLLRLGEIVAIGPVEWDPRSPDRPEMSPASLAFWKRIQGGVGVADKSARDVAV